MLVANLRDADIPAVAELWRRVDLVRPWNDPLADLQLARDSATSAVLVGRLHASVVGSVMVGFDGHRGWVYYLAVDPAQQRQGLGRQLVRAAESWLRGAGAPKVQLMVRSGSEAAVGFYAALGYQPQEVEVHGKWLR